MAWLAGEPQLWFLGVAMMVVSAPRPRVVVGVVLGVALVTVQMVPFAAWVAEGDRGPGVVDDLLRGHLVPVEWLGLVHPMEPVGDRMVFAESLFVSAPLLVLMVLGARRRPWVGAAAAVLAGVATLPAVGAGDLYVALTGGLVRYPSRFALVGAALLIPLAALGWRPWLEGRGRAVGVIVAGLAAVAVVARPGGPQVWLAIVPALAVVAAVVWPEVAVLRTGAVAVGLAATVVASFTLLELGPGDRLAVGTRWPEARRAGRLWSPTPDMAAMAAVSADLEVRRTWPVGYLNLTDGVTVADTPAPVTHRALRRHLAEVDRGPTARWWLDVLGVRWVVLPPGSVTPAGFDSIARRSGFSLWRNPRAVPVGRRTAEPPVIGEQPVPQPALTVVRRGVDCLSITTHGSAGGVMWFPITPVTGWRWSLDGRRVRLTEGPGVVQFLEVPAGLHRIEGRYRPPGWPLAAVVSLLALVTLTAMTIVSLVASPGYDSKHEGGP